VAGGGTIRITTKADGIVRADLDGVIFSSTTGCNATVSAVRYYDPPESLLGGGFSFTLWFIGATSGATDYVNVVGGFSSGNTLSGTATYTAAFAPEQGCVSDPVSWNASGPVDTPPGPDDPLLEGALSGTEGAISITIDDDRAGITSITLAGAELPCIPNGEAVDVRAFFEPPAAFDETAVISFTPSDPLDSFLLAVSIDQLDSELISGSIESRHPISACTGSTAFTTQAVPTPTPTSVQPTTGPGSPTGPATSSDGTPGARATPAATAGPIALPEAGRGAGGDGGASVWWVPVALGAVLMAGAVLVRATRGQT
jgi:hypothetical protein